MCCCALGSPRQSPVDAELHSDVNAGQSIMLPLTSSLYVSGEVEDVEKVLVDVGTGYFVEVRQRLRVAGGRLRAGS
jgi:hypothetical protein